MELYCLHYNNYYNRIIKKEDTVNGYLPYLLYKAENINFNPNDGVSTTQILNWNVESMPDYIVAVNGNDIISRWFIMEMSRTRNGQYSLILRRDLIADNYEPIINAPCFIEKATLNQDDPMIYNSEDMSFNQIKTSETLLKDKSEVSWIVGYYAKDYVDPDDENISLTVSDVALNEPIDIVLNGNISEWEYYEYIKKNYISHTLDEIVFKYYQQTPVEGYTQLNYPYASATSVKPGTVTAPWYPISSTNSELKSNLTTYSQFRDRGNLFNNNLNYDEINRLYPQYLEPIIDLSVVDNLLQLNNKTISFIDGNGNIQIKKIYSKKRKTYNPVTPQINTELFNVINSSLNILKAQNLISGESNSSSFTIANTSEYIEIKLLEYTNKTTSTTIKNQSQRYNLNDQPYSMFAIPYGNIMVNNTGNNSWQTFTTSEYVSLNIAYALIEKYSGAGVLYDVQLLPYCPMQGIISSENAIDLKNDAKLYSLIQSSDGTTNYGVIINCTENTFSLNIPLSITTNDKKIENLTDMHRLCSPNMNGAFEFSVAKNDGIDYINVDCEYRPYTPYIHLNPNFKGLYGQDFNGARGLICAGDFGLTQITDAWQTYQIQNKNYENIFNRQIQNMQVNNAVQKEKEIWSAAAGAISAGTSGAVAGGMIRGPIGAVVGGLVSGGISAAAGARDIALSQRLRDEAIDYTKDQYGYQLGNIMALPDSITKVSSFNPNNKIFPFIEYYTCTDVEKEALRNKLKYNGMTVMRIGNIREFLQSEPSYIKGKLIRLEDISDEYHIVNEIANEIYKGVFI